MRTDFPLPHHPLFLLPALLAVLAYFPATNFDYVWDDYHYVVLSGNVDSWQALWAAAWQSYLGTENYFRPLAILTLGLGGAEVAHGLNIALHAANAALVAGLCASMLEPGDWRHAPLLAASLYALHPALMQSVAWVSCRFDLLLTLFGLCLLHALHIRHHVWRVLSLFTAFLAAALSKESAIALAPIGVVWMTMRQTGGAEGLLRRLSRSLLSADSAAIALAGLVYLWLRNSSLGGLQAFASGELTATQHLLLILKTLGFYTQYTLAPFSGLAPLYETRWPLSPTDPLVAVGVVSVAVMLLLLIRLPLRGNTRLALIGYFLALIPVLNINPLALGDSFASDRLLTLPLVFACIAAGLAIGRRLWSPETAPSFRSSVIMLLSLWLAASAWTISQVLPNWRNNAALWSWAVRVQPDSTVAQNNHLTSLAQRGLHEEVIRFALHLDRIRQGDMSTSQRMSLARSLSVLGRHDAALAQLDRILQDHGHYLAPPDIGALCADKAWLHMEIGDLANAEILLVGAIKLGDTNPETEFHLGAVLAARGEAAEGDQRIRNALSRATARQRHSWTGRIDQLISDLRELQALRLDEKPHATGLLAKACT
jgi:tetratricopeptide (TPR) repeat protein